MSTTPPLEVLKILCGLATQPGTLWSALMARASPGLNCVSVHADGSPRPSSPTESVLIEAIMTASNALSERLGLGHASDFEHRFDAGGLLIHCPDATRCLILCHGQDAPVALLRLGLRAAGGCLPAPSLPPPAHELEDFSFSGAGSPTTTPDFGMTPDPLAPNHSEVYNPFIPA
jgi:hypothetical protein